MLNFPETLYIANTFMVPDRKLLPELLRLLPTTCVANKIVLRSGTILQSASDLVPLLLKAGSQLSYL